MAWNYERADQRIRSAIADAPQVRVETFEQYAPRVRSQFEATGRLPPREVFVRDLGRGEAVVVDTVQIYVNVINYNEMRTEAGRETEQSHGRALSFLHVHYASLDKVTEGAGAQRVDFHGPRMHSVLVAPTNNVEALQDAVRQGLRLARETMDLSAAASRDITRSQVPPKFRVGIDVGRCVAIDSGKQGEREPLFIGPAANHAAKLAEGDDEGIYLSDNVRRLFNQIPTQEFEVERRLRVTEASLGNVYRDGFVNNPEVLSARVEALRSRVREHRDSTIGTDGFVFHHHTPPLKSIDYQKLSPSHSIRMPLVSIFADLDKYTAYVDRAVRHGGVGEAVRVLHVIRNELNEVLQSDFSGRKVRFIGDCIHGVIAEGTSSNTDLARTVELASACVGALRSSFELCQQHLLSAQSLGLAIGFELGETPISRIGIRGDRAVRVASSVATLAAEWGQRGCLGNETLIGENARRYASPDTLSLFNARGVGAGVDYDAVLMTSSAAAEAAGEGAQPFAETRHHDR